MKLKMLKLAAVTLAVSCFAGRAYGSESRAQALLYNLAFEDSTDVFLFPELLTDYDGTYMHLTPAGSNIHGGLILDFGGQALGVFVHRPFVSAFDQYRMTATDGDGSAMGLFRGAAGAAGEQHLAGQAFDLMYGTGSFGAGLRFHGWSELSKQEGLLADPAEANSAVMFSGNLGFKYSEDTHLHAMAGYREVKESGRTVDLTGGFRWIESGPGPAHAVMAGEVEFGIFSPAEGDSSQGLTVPFKGGVQWKLLRQKLQLGLLAGVDLQYINPAPGDAKFGLAAPTLEIAAEYELRKWLQLRTALKSGYGFQLAGEANKKRPKYEQMVFNSGLGFLFEALRLDAVIQYSLWQSGPYFIGGAAGLFAGVSLSYVWTENDIEGLNEPGPAPAAPVYQPRPLQQESPPAPPAPVAPVAPYTPINPAAPYAPINPAPPPPATPPYPVGR